MRRLLLICHADVGRGPSSFMTMISADRLYGHFSEVKLRVVVDELVGAVMSLSSVMSEDKTGNASSSSLNVDA